MQGLPALPLDSRSFTNHPERMAAYLIRRLWQMVPTLFGVVLLVFFLFKWFGSDPAEVIGGLGASPEQIQAIRTQLGLNEPWWVQVSIFLKQIVTFDWGRSWATNEPVGHLFATRLPATLTVMTPILVLDALLALPIAMWVAYRRGSLTDRAIMVTAPVALSISFLVYIIVGQYLFGFQLGWFPVQGGSDSTPVNLLQYVPLDAPLKISRLTLRNRSGRTRRLAVTAYAEWVLGTSREASAPFIVTAIDATSGAMLARRPWGVGFPGRVAFADLGGRQTAWTGDRAEFLGRWHRFETPRILGIDELYLNKRYRCILTNIEERTLASALVV